MFVPVPEQIVPSPPTANPVDGKGSTRTEWTAEVALQVFPSVTVYEMSVDPADIGVTTPELFIVAVPLFEEAQVYDKARVPDAFEVSEIDPSIHVSAPPLIGPAVGRGLTVAFTTFDSAAPEKSTLHETLATRLYQVSCVIDPGLYVEELLEGISEKPATALVIDCCHL